MIVSVVFLSAVSGFVLWLGSHEFQLTHDAAKFARTSCSSNISWSERSHGKAYALTTETGLQQLVQLQYPWGSGSANDAEISAWLASISGASPSASFACFVLRNSSIVLPDGRVALAGMMNRYRCKTWILFFVLGAFGLMMVLIIFFCYTMPVFIACARAVAGCLRTVWHRAIFGLNSKESMIIRQEASGQKNICLDQVFDAADGQKNTVCLDQFSNADHQRYDYYVVECV